MLTFFPVQRKNNTKLLVSSLTLKQKSIELSTFSNIFLIRFRWFNWRINKIFCSYNYGKLNLIYKININRWLLGNSSCGTWICMFSKTKTILNDFNTNIKEISTKEFKDANSLKSPFPFLSSQTIKNLPRDFTCVTLLDENKKIKFQKSFPQFVQIKLWIFAYMDFRKNIFYFFWDLF